MKGFQLKIAEWGILFLRLICGDAFDHAIAHIAAKVAASQAIQNTRNILIQERISICSETTCIKRFGLKKVNGLFWCGFHASQVSSRIYTNFNKSAIAILFLITISACGPAKNKLNASYDSGYSTATQECVHAQMKIADFVLKLSRDYREKDLRLAELNQLDTSGTLKKKSDCWLYPNRCSKAETAIIKEHQPWMK